MKTEAEPIEHLVPKPASSAPAEAGPADAPPTAPPSGPVGQPSTESGAAPGPGGDLKRCRSPKWRRHWAPILRA